MNESVAFDQRAKKNINGIGDDQNFLDLTHTWLLSAHKHNYAYNFSWLGRPLIQIPQDIYAVQEIVWKVKPDLIIETGVAHGGSLILSASMMALLDYTDAITTGSNLNPLETKRQVIGIDIDIRHHNRAALEEHPLYHLIKLIEGSSVEPGIIRQVKNIAANYKRIMIFLDSNHTHEHVLKELEAYAPLVSQGSYCVVWDSGVENLPDELIVDRPWRKGDNPKTALLEYITMLEEGSIIATDKEPLKFEIDKEIEHKITITASEDGFLRRV